jgi:hypothetical protein
MLRSDWIPSKILNPLAGKSKFFVKDSLHFLQLLKSVDLQSLDTLVTLEVVSIFTNLPIDEVLQLSDISSRTITHCPNDLSYRSKLSWNYWNLVSEPYVFKRTISYSNRNPTLLWEALYFRSTVISLLNILKKRLLTQSNIHSQFGFDM